MGALDVLESVAGRCAGIVREIPPSLLLLFLGTTCLGAATLFYLALFIVAPAPRPPRPSEKTFLTILPDGSVSKREQLPCWLDGWAARKESVRHQLGTNAVTSFGWVDEADLYMSVVVPAYNEEERLSRMLDEAVDYLQERYGDAQGATTERNASSRSSSRKIANGQRAGEPASNTKTSPAESGWEILIVSDGSTDKTIDRALNFARDHQLSEHVLPDSELRTTSQPTEPEKPPHGSIRVISLEENRGKGGAVTHGMRHARGRYVVFADADGASTFGDLAKLVSGCQAIEDSSGRGVAIGSRAHLVGSEAVVKRSKLRNFLMHMFHFLLRMMTPPATSRIKDTQCGFKLFSRAALPHIIPYMHSEAWIFDVEMLMLAESAHITVAEVAVGWKEVTGSKLNVIWDSLGMAWGLAILRSAWALGVYRRA